MPTLYTAIASYSGSARGSQVSGYTATVQYTGEVSKTEAGKTQYTLVYRGKEIAPVTTEQTKAKCVVFPTVLFILLLVVAASGKSFAAKQEIVSVILNNPNDEVLIVDSEREYGQLVRAMGGEVVNISATSPNYINTLNMTKDYADGENLGLSKVHSGRTSSAFSKPRNLEV